MISKAQLESLLAALASGELSRDQVVERVRAPKVESLGFASLDHDRANRRGFPEVIYGPGKRDDQLAEIFARLADKNPNVLCTRASESGARRVLDANADASYDEISGTLSLWRERASRGKGHIAIVSAGTSDQKAAREAQICAQVMGNEVRSYVDVGVAGLHRLLAHVDEIREARVLICVAGMEAALPSVAAGLVDCPVISVPTSVGYGASFDGLSALLGSLNACAAGVTTVNIDNGFGAAYAASQINRL